MLKNFVLTIVSFIGERATGGKWRKYVDFFLRICFFQCRLVKFYCLLLKLIFVFICWVGRTLSPTNYNILYRHFFKQVSIESNQVDHAKVQLTDPCDWKSRTSGNFRIHFWIRWAQHPRCAPAHWWCFPVVPHERWRWRVPCLVEDQLVPKLAAEKLRTKNHEHALEWQLKKCDTIHISWCSHYCWSVQKRKKPW